MAPAPSPASGLPEHQNRGAKTVKNRAKERARNETSTADMTDDSTIDATPNATTGATKCPKHAATTSTAPPARPGYIFSDTPSPLPGIYGSILSDGHTKRYGSPHHDYLEQ